LSPNFNLLDLVLPQAILSLKPKNIAIKLKPNAELRIKKEQHPWVFDESIVKQSKEGQPGDLAIVFDKRKDEFLACGLYDPNSPIRIKLFQFLKSSKIDKQWFDNKVRSAYDIRKPLLETDTNAYRLIFGENDGLPGLITDVYDDIVVVKLYSEMWFPYLTVLLPSIIDKTKCTALVIRLARNTSDAGNKIGLNDGDVIYGKLEQENIVIREHGVKFKVNVIKGHKTGFFLDHRHNRLAIGQMAQSKTVLDVFSYAGGFSVHALVGGAASVTSLDISKQALSLATENAKLNIKGNKHTSLCGDAFDELSVMIANNKKFDIVIIDPPAFAKRAKEIDRAIESYTKLARLGSQLVSRGGTLVLASCSSRITADVFFDLNYKALRNSNLKLQKKTFHDIDHPITFKEGAYLKAGYYR
jgi:23S rRNA (cytosine1962-C5)-methyltransferase